ncbi:MAG TPA: MFS transporter [Stellaceae bacterium]|nr:MFS transporter [Stellaceae bacterium]
MYRRPLPRFDMSPLRWHALVLIAAAMALAAIDRAALESMVLLARDTLHLSDNGVVVAEQAVGLGFALALPLGAVLVYLLGPRQVLWWGGIGCALATTCMGFAFNLGGAILFYLWLGVAAGSLPAAAIVSVIRWFPVSQRGAVTGALVAVGSIAEAVFWVAMADFDVRRLPMEAFVFLGLLGALWAFAWRRWYPSSRRITIVVTPPPLAEDIGEDGTATPAFVPVPPRVVDEDMSDVAVPLKPVIERGWPLALYAFIQAYGVGLCRDWLPAELLARWHKDILSDFNVTIIGNLALGAGCLLGGVLTDRCVGHSHNVTSARQSIIAFGFLGAALALIPMATAMMVPQVILWQVVTYIFLGITAASIWCLALDIAPVAPAPLAACVAAGYGLALGLSPESLGHLVGWWVPAFLGGALLLGGTVGIFFLEPGRPLLDTMEPVIPLSVPDEPLEPMVLETETAKAYAAMRAEREWEAQPMDDDELLASLRSQGLIKSPR